MVISLTSCQQTYTTGELPTQYPVPWLTLVVCMYIGLQLCYSKRTSVRSVPVAQTSTDNRCWNRVFIALEKTVCMYIPVRWLRDFHVHVPVKVYSTCSDCHASAVTDRTSKNSYATVQMYNNGEVMLGTLMFSVCIVCSAVQCSAVQCL